MVIDARLRKKYQAQPGRQEWITAVECVRVDVSSIPLLIIYKEKDLLNTWIPLDLVNKWHFS